MSTQQTPGTDFILAAAMTDIGRYAQKPRTPSSRH